MSTSSAAAPSSRVGDGETHTDEVETHPEISTTTPQPLMVPRKVPVILSGQPTYKAICDLEREFKEYKSAKIGVLNRESYVDPPVLQAMCLAWGAPKKERHQVDELAALSDDKFFEILKEMYPDPKRSKGTGLPVDREIKNLQVPMDFDSGSMQSITTYAYQFNTLRKEWSTQHSGMTAAERTTAEATLVSSLIERLKSPQYWHKLSVEDQGKRAVMADELQGEWSTVSTFDDYLNLLYQFFYTQASEASKRAANNELMASFVSPTKKLPYQPAAKGGNQGQQQQAFQHSPKKRGHDDTSAVECWGCGREGHMRDMCVHGPKTAKNPLGRSHPDFNLEKRPWPESAKGIAWASRKDHKGRPITMLPVNRDLDGNEVLPKFDRSMIADSTNGNKPSTAKANNKQGTSLLNSIVEQCQLCNQCSPFFTSTVWTSNRQKEQEALVLMDTGSLDNNFISEDLYSKLVGPVPKCEGDCRLHTVKTAVRNHVVQICFRPVTFNLKFVNDKREVIELTNLTALLLNTHMDIILGHPTLLMYGFFHNHFPSKFVLSSSHNSVCNNVLSPYPLCMTSHTHSINDEGTDIRELLGLDQLDAPEPTIPEEVYSITDLLKGLNLNISEQDHIQRILSDVKFGVTDPHQKHVLSQLCIEFKDIFCYSLRNEPADLPPMTITVDDDAWFVPAHQQRVRKQSPANEQVAAEQVKAMLDTGVIRSCMQRAYSQVVLAPKPNSKEKRFCVDYRALNACTEDITWPMPNIRTMMNRIGGHKCKYMAKFDLYKGFFQMPLDSTSMKYTAFAIWSGLYMFNRVPMGVKGATAYFQCMLTTIVLLGLVHIICEVYIDDIIVFGETFEIFVGNLREVLLRLRRYKLILNPPKCYLGFNRLEFVGITIDEGGMSMSQDKIDKVVNFVKPHTCRQLQSFLGLTNYFRMHLADYANVAKPLYDLIPVDRRKQGSYIITFTEQAEAAYHKLVGMIQQLPKLHFLSDELPIHLKTDASDYAIGAYLCQIRGDQEELPIAFMSKALTKQQLSWTTTEKEAFAIYVALHEFEYLIYDREITLWTDHANLTYIKNSLSQKVLRWKVAFQGLRAKVKHIDGKRNLIADFMSRGTKEALQLSLDSEGSSELMHMGFMSHDIDVFEQPMNNDQFETHSRGNDAAMHERQQDVVEVNHQLLLEQHESLVALLRLITIPEHIYNQIKIVHNDVAGHHGFERTLDLLRSAHIDFQDKSKWVRHFIRQCPYCQKMKERFPEVNAHHFTVANTTPMTQISVDSIGPLPKSRSGKEHLLVIIDNFSRFVELYPIQSVESKEAARCLLQFVGRYGIPLEIVSDCGTQFVNELITEFVRLVGADRILTIPHSKEQNAIVERCNKEVLRKLMFIMLEKHNTKDWDEFYPIVQRILNASVHSALGTSPASILFGKAIDLDRAILYPQQEVTNGVSQPVRTYLDNLIHEQAVVIQRAQDFQQQRIDERLSQFENTRTTSFPINSYVLALYPNTRMGHKPPTKFHTKWRGPYKVTAVDKDTYTLLDLVYDKPFTIHVSALKQFLFDPARTNPEHIARRDSGATVVERILEHCGNLNPKTDLDFKVRWEGLPEEYDLWVPWRELRCNAKLHDYLRSKGLARLIPKDC